MTRSTTARARQVFALAAVAGLLLSMVTAGETSAKAKVTPKPTATSQCSKGGYKKYGFKNQGACVSYVKASKAKAAKQSSGVATVKATPTTAAAGGKRGGNLNFGFAFDAFTSWDPAAQSFASPQLNAIYESLIEQDNLGNLTPRLAESITSTDAKTWTIKLRPNLKFSDGSPLGAADLVYNWKREQDPATQSPLLTAFNTWQSYKQVDPLTVQVVLKDPNGQFPRLLQAGNIGYIAKPAQIQSDPSFGEHPIGTGAFRVVSWKRNDTLELERNPYYWEPGKPYLDKVTVKTIADSAQRYNALKTGAIDCLSWFEDPSRFATAKKDGFKTIPAFPADGGRMVAFNMSKAPFNDIRARQAIAYMYDRDGFNKSLYDGTALNPTTFFSPSSPFYDPSLKLPQYDPKKAQDLLDAMYKDTGQPLRFTFTVNAITSPIAEFLQAVSQSFRNVEIKIRTVSNSQQASSLATGDFEAIGADIGGQPDPDTTLYNSFHSGLVTNYIRISDPAMDTALERGRKSLDLESRRAAYLTVQKVFLDQVPATIAAAYPVGLMSTKSVVGCDRSLVPILARPLWRDVYFDH